MLALATGQLLPEGRLREVAEVFAATVAAVVSAMLARASARAGAGRARRWHGDRRRHQGVVGRAGAADRVRADRGARRAGTRRSAGPGASSRCSGWAPASGSGSKRGDPGGQAGLARHRDRAARRARSARRSSSVLGGVALVLFLAEGVPSAAIPAETYRLGVNPTLAAIPLFTLAGFALAEGKAASERLLRAVPRVLRLGPGRNRGGDRGAVRVLHHVHRRLGRDHPRARRAAAARRWCADGYREKFALGLITASGSNGLLWPPALPLILYSIVAEIPYENLFIAGAVPGLIMLGMVVTLGRARRAPREGEAHPLRREGGARGAVAGEVGGAAPGRRAGRHLRRLRHHRRVGRGRRRSTRWSRSASSTATSRCGATCCACCQQCALVVGGVLVILGVAVGLTSYLVDAQVAARVTEWAQATHPLQVRVPARAQRAAGAGRRA